MWINGELYEGKEYMYPLSEWHIIVGMLARQMHAKKIDYREYAHMLEREIGMLP